MWAFFVRPEQNREAREHNLVKDILRVIRDLIAVANDLVHLNILTMIIDSLNQLIGDESRPQSQP